MKNFLTFFIAFFPLISYATNSASPQSEYTDPYLIEYTDSYYSMYDRRKGETSLVMNVIKSRIGSEARSFSLNLYKEAELRTIVGKFWFIPDEEQNKKDKGECIYKGEKVCEIGYASKYDDFPFFRDVKKRKTKSGFDCSFVHFARFQSWGIFEFNEVTDKWFRIVTEKKESIYISRKEYFDNLKKIDFTLKAYLRPAMTSATWMKELHKPLEEQKKKLIAELKSGKVDFELNYVDGYVPPANYKKEIRRIELVKSKLTFNEPKARNEDLKRLRQDMVDRAIYLLSNLSVYDFILNKDKQRIIFEDQAFSYEPKASMKFKKEREHPHSQSAFRLQLYFAGNFENGASVRFDKITADTAVYNWGRFRNVDSTMCDFGCFVRRTQKYYLLSGASLFEKELDK